MKNTLTLALSLRERGSEIREIELN